MSVTKRTNLAAIGIMASDAAKSHGAVPENGICDGNFSSCGGPMDPHAGLYEEQKPKNQFDPAPNRFHGVQDLKSAALTRGASNGEDNSLPQSLRAILGMSNGQTSQAYQQNLVSETVVS